MIDNKNELLYGVPYWACGFETNSRKINSYHHTTFTYKKEPAFGVCVLIEYEQGYGDKATKERIGIPISKYSKHWRPFYFVPFKKNYKGNGKNWTDKDLAFSKRVEMRSRKYADTYEKCVELYNGLIDDEVNKHKEIINELESYKIKKGN